LRQTVLSDGITPAPAVSGTMLGAANISSGAAVDCGDTLDTDGYTLAEKTPVDV
jgi:hypothetical protein